MKIDRFSSLESVLGKFAAILDMDISKLKNGYTTGYIHDF